MRTLTCLVLLLLAGSGAFAQKGKANAGANSLQYSEFIPVEPIEFYDNVEVADNEGNVDLKYIKSMNKRELLEYLTNETVLVSVAEVDKTGKMSFIPGRVSDKGMQYIVTMDYLKFATLEVKKEGDVAGEAAAGVGFRVILNISSRAKDINLSDIFSIGMAATDKKVYGSVRVEAIGLHDPEVTSVIPLPSEISGASIQSVMQAITIIKYKIYDEKTRLHPQIVGIRGTKEGVTLQELREAVMKYHKLGKKNVATNKSAPRKK